jgi:hypothetical protein
MASSKGKTVPHPGHLTSVAILFFVVMKIATNSDGFETHRYLLKIISNGLLSGK